MPTVRYHHRYVRERGTPVDTEGRRHRQSGVRSSPRSNRDSDVYRIIKEWDRKVDSSEEEESSAPARSEEEHEEKKRLRKNKNKKSGGKKEYTEEPLRKEIGGGERGDSWYRATVFVKVDEAAVMVIPMASYRGSAGDRAGGGGGGGSHDGGGQERMCGDGSGGGSSGGISCRGPNTCLSARGEILPPPAAGGATRGDPFLFSPLGHSREARAATRCRAIGPPRPSTNNARLFRPIPSQPPGGSQLFRRGSFFRDRTRFRATKPDSRRPASSGGGPPTVLATRPSLAAPT